MYTVSYKDEDKQFESRAAAIEAAKSLTDGSHASAQVSDEHEVESFVYREGEMESYVYDLRRVEQIRRGMLNDTAKSDSEDDADGAAAPREASHG